MLADDVCKVKLLNDLGFFTRYFFLAQYGKRFIVAGHHARIAEALTRVVSGETKRLVINIPPRYGKTELAVKMFVAWCLANSPSAKFIHLSYSDDLALDNSSAIRDVVKSPEFQRFFPIALRADSDSKKKWWTSVGGGLYATSTGGPITGFGAGALGRVRSGTGSPCDAFPGCLILDDPIKPDDAFSDTMRDRINRRFNNTFMSRLNSQDTPIIVIMQRLHENDMTGYLLGGGSGEKWEHLCLTAITDDGESLWPEKLDIATLRQMEAADPYTFSGQYQQTPSPLAGGILKPDNIAIIEALPVGPIEWVRGWDFASTTTGDWTAGAKMGRLPDGRIIIADMVRVRVGPDERDAALVNATARDGANCRVSIPQDPGQAGVTQVKYLLRQLAGYSVKATPESGNKVVRCEPFASQVNVGNVLMLRADWNTALINEMRMFPNGTWDDQVDACSRAFSMLIGNEPVQIFWTDPVGRLGGMQPALAGSLSRLAPGVFEALADQPLVGEVCGRCVSFDKEQGYCTERNFTVGAKDHGCDMFIASGS